MTIETTKYDVVDASPVKSFFVNMLIRDITLHDAILDLLDNCVDGILRMGTPNSIKPFEGYKAEITFSNSSFSISDNCGGIPWDLHPYAFRMGRPDNRPDEAFGSVGVYGVGMKRALFKIGQHVQITTANQDDHYQVVISPDWLENESQWEIPAHPVQDSQLRDGTVITVTELHPRIASTFGSGPKGFTHELKHAISTHYAYILDKGLQVTVNGETVIPSTTEIVFNSTDDARTNVVQPFIFEATRGNVDIFLAVGFTQPPPTSDELAAEQEGRYSSGNAGWTILCNDRAILHCDRTEVTGWGESTVPRYHPQFIAISGIVDLRSENPAELPTTTTKRGIDASSPLYLQIKNKMREGMKLFTDYTNKWKGDTRQAHTHIQNGQRCSLTELKEISESLRLRQTERPFAGQQYKPRLPLPPQLKPTTRRISYLKEITAIDAVAEYLGDVGMSASDVGEACFDAIFEGVGK